MMKRKSSGFTLVEIMIVVVVIAILAAIVIVGYGAWKKGASENVVKSDLTVLFAKMESVRQATNQYPTSVPSDVAKNNSTEFIYVSGNATTYCIQGDNTGDDGVFYHITQSSQSLPQDGTCPGYDPNPAPPAAPGLPGNVILSTNTGVYKMLLCWDAVAGATGYDMRYQIRGSGSWIENETGLLRMGVETFPMARFDVADFYVRAKNAGGTSAWAGPRSVTATYGGALPTVDNPSCRDNS